MREFQFRQAQRAGASAARIFAFGNSGGPRIPGFAQVMFDAEGGAGSGSAEAEAAAAKAAADKAAADAAAKAAADKSGMSDEAAKLLKENMGQKAKLEAAATEKAALEAKLKEFEGLDPAAAKKLVADKAEADKAALIAKGEFDKVKEMMAAEHTKEITKVKSDVTAKEGIISGLTAKIADLTMNAAFAASKFIADSTVLPISAARATFGAHFDVENDQVVAFDKPKGVEGRTKLVDARGVALPFDTAIEKFVTSNAEADKMLKSKLAAGASSKTDAGAGTGAAGAAGTALTLKDDPMAMILAGLAAKAGAK